MERVPPDGMETIDTAPTDGTRIIVWREGVGLYSVSWFDGSWRLQAGRAVPLSEVTLWKPQPVPQSPGPAAIVVSASQAKIALFNVGLLDTVKALVAAHPYEPVRIWYADANQWEQNHRYVRALGAELGLTDDDIAGLFQTASLL